MNVKIGTEAAQFPEKEYINVIFVAVRMGFKNVWFAKFAIALNNTWYWQKCLLLILNVLVEVSFKVLVSPWIWQGGQLQLPARLGFPAWKNISILSC